MLRSSTAPEPASAWRSSRSSASKPIGSPSPPYSTPGTRPLRRRRRALREPSAERLLTLSFVVVLAMTGDETLAIAFVRYGRAHGEQRHVDAREEVARAANEHALHHRQGADHRPRQARPAGRSGQR